MPENAKFESIHSISELVDAHVEYNGLSPGGIDPQVICSTRTAVYSTAPFVDFSALDGFPMFVIAVALF